MGSIGIPPDNSLETLALIFLRERLGALRRSTKVQVICRRCRC